MSSKPTPPLVLNYAPEDHAIHVHALSVVQGKCPTDVLASWRDEFARFYDQYGEGTPGLKITFKSGPPALPKTFDVEILGNGRGKTARLTASVNGRDKSATESSPTSANPSQPATDWRNQMLEELDRFVVEFAHDDAERTSLEFAVQQMRLLAQQSPERLTLMLFAAFVAGAHSPNVQEASSSADLVLQAAAAALRRAVDEADVPGTPDGTVDGANPAWRALRMMSAAWMTLGRRTSGSLHSAGERMPHA